MMGIMDGDIYIYSMHVYVMDFTQMKKETKKKQILKLKQKTQNIKCKIQETGDVYFF